MLLPERLIMKEIAHGHGDKGMAFYEYEDADGLGVVLDSRRPDSRSRFVETYRFKWLPDQTFTSYGALHAAVARLSYVDTQAEKAKWPQLTYVRESLGGTKGSCWFHTDQPGTHSGEIATCWIHGCADLARLCAQCTEAAQTDPQVIVRARDKRIADVAARAALRLQGATNGQ